MIDGAPAARFTERLKARIESGYGLTLGRDANTESTTRQRVKEAVTSGR